MFLDGLAEKHALSKIYVGRLAPVQVRVTSQCLDDVETPNLSLQLEVTLPILRHVAKTVKGIFSR